MICVDCGKEGNCGMAKHPYCIDDPMGAIIDFMRDNNDFVIDNKQEKFLLTQNPKGYYSYG